MEKKSVKVKKVLYIVLLVVLSLVFVASIVFGTIAAFTTTAREEIEVWLASTFDKERSLLKTSIVMLIISSLLLMLILSFKDFKKKYID